MGLYANKSLLHSFYPRVWPGEHRGKTDTAQFKLTALTSVPLHSDLSPSRPVYLSGFIN